MNFFETLIHPDKEEAEFAEKAIILSAANLLQVGEFQLLQLAYRDWFARDLNEDAANRLFSAYMLQNQVPFWARHYARRLLEREDKGLIDENDPAYHRYDNYYERIVSKDRAALFLLLLVVGFIFGGSFYVAAVADFSATSLLPPYFGADELPSFPPQPLGK
jgi:hypothetical protein